MRQCVVGLDLSLTATGMVRVYGSGVNDWTGITFGYGLKKPSLQDKIKRIDAIANKVIAYVLESNTDAVAIENYAFSGRGQVFDLAELFGVVKRDLYEIGVIPKMVTVTTARRFLMGRGCGGIKKKELMRYLKMMKFNFEDDNQMDAWVVANFYRAELGLPAKSGGFQSALY